MPLRDIIEHIAEVVKKDGTDVWWEKDESYLLPPKMVKEYQDQEKELPKKGTDIFDIWLDSGCSWNTVLRTDNGSHDGSHTQADLYLEGIDQFTGWFQSSLLTSVAVTGRPPYK